MEKGRHLSKLLEHMQGKEVLVVTNATQKLSGDQGTMESSVHHRGFLLDYDDEFVYLGYDFDNIHALVAKATIVSIVDANLFEEQEAMQDLMSDYPVDPNKIN